MFMNSTYRVPIAMLNDISAETVSQCFKYFDARNLKEKKGFLILDIKSLKTNAEM